MRSIVVLALTLTLCSSALAIENKEKVCVKVPSIIVLDGDLSEWGKAVAIDLEKEGKINLQRKDVNDISAVAYTMWDEKNFYLAIVVTDDIHMNASQDSNIWNGDSIQFALDPSPEDRNDIFNDYEMGMALTPKGPCVWRWAPTSEAVKSAELFVERKENKTIYELKLPFAEIGFVPAKGKSLGFTFTLNESDDAAKGFRGWIEWTPGICGYKDSMFWGKLTLEDKKN